jgi:hypothetical protein
MIGSIFTPKYIVIVAVLFALSSIISISLSRKSNSETVVEPSDPVDAPQASDTASPLPNNSDTAIDSALGFAVNGNHIEAVKILKPLADKGVIRAKLYLATAYYHGNGIAKDREKARSLFFELQAANYEPHIVSTYLSLLGSPQ